MIVNKVWDGSQFINTDADTVDGFHANSITSLYKNVFMSGHDGFQFTATGNVTSFAIPPSIFNPTTDTAEFYFEGLRLNAIEHFSLSANTVALTFSLSQGKSIFVEINHSSYDYHDLVNKPSIGDLADLKTLTKNNLIEAVNEIYDLAAAGGNGSGGSETVIFPTFIEVARRFTAVSETSEVLIQDDIAGKKLIVYQLGIRLFEDQEYEIRNKKIHLALALDPGEYVDYVVIASTANMFPEEMHVRYNAVAEISRFNIVGEAVDRDLEVYMTGARLFKGLDYTINGNVMLLNTPLESGEYIDYIFLE